MGDKMANYIFEPIDIGGYIIKTSAFDDNRGCFVKSFEKEQFEANGAIFNVDEYFVSVSKKDVVRGMHFQLNEPQAKLVSVISGKIYDVIIDIRKGSPTLGQWRGFDLSSENHRSILVPAGFAHGFLSLADNSAVLYGCDGKYNKSFDSGIMYNDPDIGIDWRISDMTSLIVGERDKHQMSFREYLALI